MTPMTPTMQTEGSADVQMAGRDTEKELAMLNEKLALAELLRSWRNWFGDSWVTAEQVIDCFRQVDDRDLLHQVGIKTGDTDELSRRLDEVRNRVIYNFIVKRDLPYKQPVRWRVLLQDSRVKIAEEQDDFIAVRKEAGSKIDPATAEVYWHWGQVLDPYGIHELRSEESCVGRQYFARSPGSDIWVSFYDLPDTTRDAIKERQANASA